jgi:hypothetical protein
MRQATCCLVMDGRQDLFRYSQRPQLFSVLRLNAHVVAPLSVSFPFSFDMGRETAVEPGSYPTEPMQLLKTR